REVEVSVCLSGLKRLQHFPQLLDRGSVPFNKLEPQASCLLSRQLGRSRGSRVTGVVKSYHATELRKNLLQELKTLRRQVRGQIVHAGEPSARHREAIHHSHAHRLAPPAPTNPHLSR